MYGFQKPVEAWRSPPVRIFFYDCCRMYFYQHLAIFGCGFFYLLELKDIWWAEFRIYHRFHECSSQNSLFEIGVLDQACAIPNTPVCHSVLVEKVMVLWRFQAAEPGFLRSMMIPSQTNHGI